MSSEQFTPADLLDLRSRHFDYQLQRNRKFPEQFYARVNRPRRTKVGEEDMRKYICDILVALEHDNALMESESQRMFTSFQRTDMLLILAGYASLLTKEDTDLVSHIVVRPGTICNDVVYAIFQVMRLILDLDYEEEEEAIKAQYRFLRRQTLSRFFEKRWNMCFE